MISFPNAKINLGLQILRKRHDGFHDLDSVFYPIAWHDALEIIEDNEASSGFSTSFSGLSIPGSIQDNSLFKAYLELAQIRTLPAMEVHLHKTIPMGAGLGGGSSNSTHFLKLANQKFNLALSDLELAQLCRQLGSDNSFFLNEQVAWLKGKGEELTPIQLSLQPYSILIVYPGIHISTATAFAHCSPNDERLSTKAIVEHHPVYEWKDKLHNDFEDWAFKTYPDLKKIKQYLYDSKALYASMSGSGSALYGIFEKEDQKLLEQLTRKSYDCRWVNPYF